MIDCHMVKKLGAAQVILNLVPSQIMGFEEDKQESFFNLKNRENKFNIIEAYR